MRQGPRRGGRKGVAPLNKGLSRSDWGLRWEGPTGPHRSVSEVSCKGTEAVEVPAERGAAACPPTGLSPQVTGGWTDMNCHSDRTGLFLSFRPNKVSGEICRRNRQIPRLRSG